MVSCETKKIWLWLPAGTTIVATAAVVSNPIAMNLLETHFSPDLPPPPSVCCSKCWDHPQGQQLTGLEQLTHRQTTFKVSQAWLCHQRDKDPAPHQQAGTSPSTSKPVQGSLIFIRQRADARSKKTTTPEAVLREVTIRKIDQDDTVGDTSQVNNDIKP